MVFFFVTTTDLSSLISAFDAARTDARQAKGRAARSAYRGRLVAGALSSYCKLAVGAALVGVLVAVVVSL